jgi:hypothetical protein
MLASPAHQDHEVTSFLTMWNFEEFWHGDAISRVLAAHGESAGRPRVEGLRRSLGAGNRLGPTMHAIGSLVVGGSYTAVHMTWGAINEWTTQAGYARLAARAGHPTLSELFRRIMRQEGRHVDFYAAQAIARLRGNHRAQRLTRWAVMHYWKPVGSDVMPAAEVDFIVSHLFGGAGGRPVVQRLDRNIDRLPGLEQLHLLQSALDRRTAA